MERRLHKLALALTVASTLTGSAIADDKERDHDQLKQQDKSQLRDRDQARERDLLQQRDRFGWELMTPAERQQHREKLRSMKTEQEREAYRREHHKQMQDRAREKGVKLPDMPPERGHGMGPGGGGMGPGGGGPGR